MPPAIPTVAVAKGTAAFSAAVRIRPEPLLAVAASPRLLKRPSTRSVAADLACAVEADPELLRDAAEREVDLRAEVDLLAEVGLLAVDRDLLAPDPDLLAPDPDLLAPDPDLLAAGLAWLAPEPDRALDFELERDAGDDFELARDADADFRAPVPDFFEDAREPEPRVDAEPGFEAEAPLVDRVDRRRGDAEAPPLADEERCLDAVRRDPPLSFSTAIVVLPRGRMGVCLPRGPG
jgi:hypothetical protein